MRKTHFDGDLLFQRFYSEDIVPLCDLCSLVGLRTNTAQELITLSTSVCGPVPGVAAITADILSSIPDLEIRHIY